MALPAVLLSMGSPKVRAGILKSSCWPLLCRIPFVVKVLAGPNAACWFRYTAKLVGAMLEVAPCLLAKLRAQHAGF